MRVGYFTNTYPRATDTFIQLEVECLRELGLDIRTFSVRRAGADHLVSDRLKTEAENTFFILPVNPIKLLTENVKALVSNPGKFFKAINTAIKTSPPGIRGALKQLFYFQEAVILSRAMTEQEIDHVHNHFGDTSGNVTLLASILSGISYSISIHGPHIFFAPENWALKEKVKHSAFIRCISDFCASQMKLFSDPNDWDKLKIIRCGVDLGKFQHNERALDGHNILYVGRVAREKGLSVLLDSLKEIQKTGQAFELSIVGAGEDDEIIRHQVYELGLENAVNFLGYRGHNEVLKLLQTADIFVLPSFAEGVPIALMEAMALGVPVIGTNVGGIAELIENGKSGLRIPPGNSAKLSEAIKSLLASPELRRTIAKNGRETVEADYDINKNVRDLQKLFIQTKKNEGLSA